MTAACRWRLSWCVRLFRRSASNTKHSTFSASRLCFLECHLAVLTENCQFFLCPTLIWRPIFEVRDKVTTRKLESFMGLSSSEDFMIVFVAWVILIQCQRVTDRTASSVYVAFWEHASRDWQHCYHWNSWRNYTGRKRRLCIPAPAKREGPSFRARFLKQYHSSQFLTYSWTQ